MGTFLQTSARVAVVAAAPVAVAAFAVLLRSGRTEIASSVALVALLAAATAVVFLVRRSSSGEPRGEPLADPIRRARTAGATLFMLAVALQVFHQIEHIVQVVQAKVLHVQPAHALLGSFFDTEWVHVGYNSSLFAGLALTWLACGRDWRACWRERHPTAFGVFTAGILLQGYHVVEHAAKISQHVKLGLEPAPGILGFYVDLVWLHFGINLLVVTAMLVAFVELKLYPRFGPAREPVPAM